MGIKSKGRGTAAAFGLLLVFAGVVGAIVLYLLSERRPDQAVDEFARAPVGCTTTLEFTESGTVYVYEEIADEVTPPEGGCVPTASPGSPFGFEITGGGGAVVPRRDDSIDYDSGDRVGRSVARFDIDRPGDYEIEVRGDDPAVVAAIGRDPDDGVDDLRSGAIAVGIAGVLLGLLLLTLAGWRSKRAATYSPPEGPGWGPRAVSTGDSWPPEPPKVPQIPVNPHLPPAPASAESPAPLPARRPQPAGVPPWAPPTPGDAVTDGPDVPRHPLLPPEPEPHLPDAPGRLSGGSRADNA